MDNPQTRTDGTFAADICWPGRGFLDRKRREVADDPESSESEKDPRRVLHAAGIA